MNASAADRRGLLRDAWPRICMSASISTTSTPRCSASPVYGCLYTRDGVVGEGLLAYGGMPARRRLASGSSLRRRAVRARRQGLLLLPLAAGLEAWIATPTDTRLAGDLGIRWRIAPSGGTRQVLNCWKRLLERPEIERRRSRAPPCPAELAHGRRKPSAVLTITASQLMTRLDANALLDDLHAAADGCAATGADAGARAELTPRPPPPPAPAPPRAASRSSDDGGISPG